MIATRSSRRRCFAGAEDGSAAVEFAVSASVFFMTLVGLMKICLAIYTFHFVAEAACEGSRYAIVRGSSCNSTYLTSACPATGGNISTYVKGLGYPGISSSAMTVTTTWGQYPTGRTCTPSSTCDNPGDLVTVKVQYAFPLSIPFMASKTYTMQSTSAMVISQ